MDKAHFAPGHDRSDRDLHEGPLAPCQPPRTTRADHDGSGR
jgi:hypothetical protein